jgi:hypothetical protein
MRLHAIVWFTALSLSASAEEIMVKGDEELQRAITSLKDGTTLKIKPGDYRGGWSVRGIRKLTVEAADPANPPHFKKGNVGWQFSRCFDLTVRNLQVSGQHNNGLNIDDGGLRDQPVTGVTLSGLKVSDIGPRGNFDGIKCSGIDDLVIKDCEVSGWGGQAIDFVGCHRALISNCRFFGKPGFSQTTGPQFKGGSSEVVIERCFFKNAGMRPIQAGGSTGMAYFRPPGAKYEARQITIRDNTIVGGMCAVSFTGVDGATFARNIIVQPDKWVLRILQETSASGFPPCRNVRFERNVIVFDRAKVRGVVNIGANTAPKTFRFEKNLWYAADRPARSKPNLPVAETGGIDNLDPELDAKTFRPAAPRAQALLKER